MTHTIRMANPRDAAGLVELIHQHAAFERSAATITLERLEQLLLQDAPPAGLFVAELLGELVGYASLTFDYATWRGAKFGTLDCLFVRETQRSAGLGKLLFEQVAQTARQAGADRLEWQTPAWNAGAIRLYQREGGVSELKQRFQLEFLSP